MSEYTVDLINFNLTIQGWQWRLIILAACVGVVWWFAFGFERWMDNE